MFSNIGRVLVLVVNRFHLSDGWALASHVALSMIMALFPFMIFTTSLAGFLGYEAQSGLIVELVFETWPDDIAAPIVKEMNAVLREPHPGFLSIAIFLTLLFASNAVEAVRVGFNRAYRTEDRRTFVHCRVQSIVFVICGALILLMSSSFLLFKDTIQAFAPKSPIPSEAMDGFFIALKFLVSICAVMFAVIACHIWLPAGTRKFSDIWPGVLATLLLWIVSANIFKAYLATFADYSATFAGLAGTMVALIFLYLMAVVLLLGGELNAVLKMQKVTVSRHGSQSQPK